VVPVVSAAGSGPAGAASLGEEFILLGPRGSRAFDASGLEAELRSMWRSASAEGPAKGEAVYRAALANLVVPLDASGLAALSPVLVEVTRRHPSRLFLIETGATREPDLLRSRVTALCHLRPIGGAVCSEQIILQPGPGAEPLTPSAVRSLLVGELPIVLLEIGAAEPDPWREELWRGADLCLADSALGGDPEAAEPLWERIAEDDTGRIHDLAWARLTPWREILAELFDEPALRPALETLTQVEVSHGGESEGTPTAQALLLAGWLADRLRWAPERRERDALILRGERGPVRLLFPRRAEEGTRSVSRVRLRAAAPHPLRMEVERHGRDARATVRIDEPRTERQEIPFHYREFAACIVGEIHRHEPNPALREAVRTARGFWSAWRNGA
jgi:glucose-6-phosphate dehydrogenase assembly protein OpcA